MTSDDFSRVWRQVFRRMNEWEADNPIGHGGSARPNFEHVWRQETQGLGSTILDRERCWQAWLQAGKPL